MNFKLIAATLCLGFTSLIHAQVTDAQARNALEIQAGVANSYINCSPQSLAKDEDTLNNMISRADFMSASARGEMMSGHTAACGLKPGNSLVQMADLSGRLLAISVISWTRIPGTMNTPKTTSSGERAEILLGYAAQNGSPTAAQILQMLRQSNYRNFGG